MKFLTILQARYSSTRFPGKALKDFHGYPMSVLSAMRLKNNFSDVCIATSTDKSDDKLTEVFANHGFEVHRGSLENVLSRFINIINSKSLSNNDCIIRATGDNLLPDSSFLTEIKKFFLDKKLKYLAAQPKNLDGNNWPKGLSIEFINVGLLKESYLNDFSKENIEHVTPYIRSNYSCSFSGIDFIKLTNNYYGKSYSIDELHEFNFMLKQIKPTNLFQSYKDILKES